MDSAGAAIAVVAAFAILVLSSMGHPPPQTGPLCSDCPSLCTSNCINKVVSTCGMYCENPDSSRQSCEWQLIQMCMKSSCCNGTCTRDCSSFAKDACQNVPGTMIDCDACKFGLSQWCYPDCFSNCNSTCVKKKDGC